MQLLLQMLSVDRRRSVLGRLVCGDGRHLEATVQITGRQRATTVQPVTTRHPPSAHGHAFIGPSDSRLPHTPQSCPILHFSPPFLLPTLNSRSILPCQIFSQARHHYHHLPTSS